MDVRQDYETLAAKFRPIFDRIAVNASAREQDHLLPYEQIRELTIASFGALRVPLADGGLGATMPQLFALAGEVSAAAFAADATMERAAWALQAAYESAFGGDLVEEERLNDMAELATVQAQVVLVSLATRATSDIFDALAGSGVSMAKNLDRHWRNARTVASHNPWVFKARIEGDFVVNGTQPNRIWSIGAAPIAAK